MFNYHSADQQLALGAWMEILVPSTAGCLLSTHYAWPVVEESPAFLGGRKNMHWCRTSWLKLLSISAISESPQGANISSFMISYPEGQIPANPVSTYYLRLKNKHLPDAQDTSLSGEWGLTGCSEASWISELDHLNIFTGSPLNNEDIKNSVMTWQDAVHKAAAWHLLSPVRPSHFL